MAGDLGASLEPTIRPDFDTWTPIMFPPPPPPEACHPPVPCVESRTNISFTLATTREELCAPLLGHREVHVHYTGEICDPEGLKIQWTAARTLDPRLVRNAIR